MTYISPFCYLFLKLSFPELRRADFLSAQTYKAFFAILSRIASPPTHLPRLIRLADSFSL